MTFTKMTRTTVTTVFPLIADPDAYRPWTMDMVNDRAVREYWLDRFEHHTELMVRQCAQSHGDTDDARRRAQRFGSQFLQWLGEVREADHHIDLSILTLCDRRYRHYTEHGFTDPFADVKALENEVALALLPDVLRELDEATGRRRLLRAMQGVFAGNIFDLGSKATIDLYEQGGVDFSATRDRLNRPWLIDDFDALADRFDTHAHRRAVVFVDNAGADIVLGMIPFARLLLQRGAEVVLAANRIPALNDITHDELVGLIERVRAMDALIDEAIGDDRLRLVASENHLPGIDLSNVSDEMAAEAARADLLVLEGMGRCLETNYHTRFLCDTLKVAMIKEPQAADYFGGKMFDVVCRFEESF